MAKNIFAFTPNEPNPPYLSINDEGDFKLSITVRGKGTEDECGATASITLNADQWGKLLNALWHATGAFRK